MHGYVLDGDVILFDESRRRLFSLNATASFIWLASAAGVSRERIVKQLSDETGAPRERVAADVDELLAGWQDVALSGPPAAVDVSGSPLDSSRLESAPLEGAPLEGAPLEDTPLDSWRPNLGSEVGGTQPLDESEAGAATRAPRFMRAIRLGDAGIRIVGDSALASCADAVLGHLTVAPREGNDWPELELLEHADHYALRFCGRLLDRCRHRESVVPMLHGNVELLMYRASSCLAAVHAAAVARNGAGLLLPAVSGSGKSTLTAALIARGYQYCTDDLALLDEESMRVSVVPLRLGLKSGSWPVLEKLIPELAALPAYRRADYQLVKYLPYDRYDCYDPYDSYNPYNPYNPYGSHDSDDSHDSVSSGQPQGRHGGGVAVAAMVFPRFTPGAGAILRAVTRSEALVRMAAAGYDLPGQLDEPTVRKLVGWISGLACYELLFDDLEAAVAQLDGVLS